MSSKKVKEIKRESRDITKRLVVSDEELKQMMVVFDELSDHPDSFSPYEASMLVKGSFLSNELQPAKMMHLVGCRICQAFVDAHRPGWCQANMPADFDL